MRVKAYEVHCVAVSQFAEYVLEHPMANHDKTQIIAGYLDAEAFCLSNVSAIQLPASQVLLCFSDMLKKS